MKCISIMSVPRPNGRGSTDRVSVPCGKCPACLSNRRTSWAFRLSQELKDSEMSSFITLTYDDNHNDGSLHKLQIQAFLKRLRHYCIKVDSEYSEMWKKGLKVPANSKIRYFITGEYGHQTLRPHYHMLLFNHPVIPEMELYELIGKSWEQGACYIGTVTEASIMYVGKYMLKGSVTPMGCEEPFSLMSRRPGIGFEYIERMTDWHQDEQRFYVQKNDVKQLMPRYYKDKIFSKTDKEENKVKIINEIDRIENEKLYNTFAKGENPFVNDLEKSIDQLRKLKKLNKEGKL